MTIRRMYEVGVEHDRFNVHNENGCCSYFGCVPVDPGPPATEGERNPQSHTPDNGHFQAAAANLPDALTVIRNILMSYQRYFGSDPAGLPAFEALDALAAVVRLQTAAQAVVAAYDAIDSWPTLTAFCAAVHTLKAVLGKEAAP